MELQTQDLRRTRTGQSVAAPVVVVDEQAEFERLRREEMQRLDDRIKENTATVRSLACVWLRSIALLDSTPHSCITWLMDCILVDLLCSTRSSWSYCGMRLGTRLTSSRRS
jgi:hypothetical protein